ncbi:MAG: hypothetical protein GPJ54_19155 [Candidatus Heimdallarchaeota archaeon]|nr:hypothetical protein [Candidatus Heimdallarchaeota archaeon]
MAVSIKKFRYFKRKNTKKIIQNFVDLPDSKVNDNLPFDAGFVTKKTMSLMTSYEYVRMLNRIT